MGKIHLEMCLHKRGLDLNRDYIMNMKGSHSESTFLFFHLVPCRTLCFGNKWAEFKNEHPLQRCQPGPRASHDASGGPYPFPPYKTGGIHKNPLLLSRHVSITHSNPLKLSLATILTLDHLGI